MLREIAAHSTRFAEPQNILAILAILAFQSHSPPLRRWLRVIAATRRDSLNPKSSGDLGDLGVSISFAKTTSWPCAIAKACRHPFARSVPPKAGTARGATRDHQKITGTTATPLVDIAP